VDENGSDKEIAEFFFFLFSKIGKRWVGGSKAYGKFEQNPAKRNLMIKLSCLSISQIFRDRTQGENIPNYMKTQILPSGWQKG
jgi:hypothetical protein